MMLNELIAKVIDDGGHIVFKAVYKDPDFEEKQYKDMLSIVMRVGGIDGYYQEMKFTKAILVEEPEALVEELERTYNILKAKHGGSR